MRTRTWLATMALAVAACGSDDVTGGDEWPKIPPSQDGMYALTKVNDADVTNGGTVYTAGEIELKGGSYTARLTGSGDAITSETGTYTLNGTSITFVPSGGTGTFNFQGGFVDEWGMTVRTTGATPQSDQITLRFGRTGL